MPEDGTPESGGLFDDFKLFKYEPGTTDYFKKMLEFMNG